MIQLLMGIAALLLLFVSYYLLKKQPIFNRKNRKKSRFLAIFWRHLCLFRNLRYSRGFFQSTVYCSILFDPRHSRSFRVQYQFCEKNG